MGLCIGTANSAFRSIKVVFLVPGNKRLFIRRSQCQLSLATQHKSGNLMYTGKFIASVESGIPLDEVWISGSVSAIVGFDLAPLIFFELLTTFFVDHSTLATQPPNALYWRFLGRR